ncbi:predicted protein [Nematostella vectensis]|uniref:G-protein coupled receptors family 1 profile domain-containing protein n=1 Tax=Nematostella vectensis TaxID=45351 RepID=A7SM13_NEMVE|nr:predicted protein [Nematostella vectensis]|eukprot:XP_001627345.1 predicted protein [Nematostella vectensis]
MDNLTLANSTEITPTRSIGERVIQAIVLSIICLTSVLGNALVAATIHFDYRLHKPTFYFIASLSVADIIVGAVYVPFFAVAVLDGWGFGTIWCDVLAVTVSLSFNASLVTLALVSWDRYLAITKPLRYQAFMTSERAAALIAGAWVHSLFWAASPSVGWGEIAFDLDTNICRIEWSSKVESSKVYSLFLAFFAFFIPTAIMIYCYCKIFKVARHHVKQIKQNSVSSQQSVTVNDTRALKTILIVIGAFAVAWLPYTMFSLTKLFAPGVVKVEATGSNAVLTVTLLNGCINPVIYSLRDKRFRNGIRKRLCPCCVKTEASQEFSCVTGVHSASRYTNPTVIVTSF